MSAFNASAMSDTRKFASASFSALHMLGTQSLHAVKETLPPLLRTHSHDEVPTHQLAVHPEHHAIGDPLPHTALHGPQQAHDRTIQAHALPVIQEHPIQEPAAHDQEPEAHEHTTNEHIVYLVMQPIAAASKPMDDIRSKMHGYLGGAIDFPTLFAMLAVQHWAVLVDGHYYHLKRLIDESLALDITPFAENATFLKVPLWKTKFSHEERAGIGVCHNYRPFGLFIESGARFRQAFVFLEP
jgi:hypothetical protein